MIDETFTELCACFVTDSQGQAVPSRWSGARCLDYAITNAAENLGEIAYSTEAIADHKFFHCKVKIPDHRKNAWPYRLIKHSKLCKPDNCSLAGWDKSCNEFLSSHAQPVPPQQVDQQTMNHYWSEVSSFMRKFSNMPNVNLSRLVPDFPTSLPKKR